MKKGLSQNGEAALFYIFEKGMFIMTLGSVALSFGLAALSGICFVSGIAILAGGKK